MRLVMRILPVLAIVALLPLTSFPVVQGEPAALPRNGGFERDDNLDGVPDGWTPQLMGSAMRSAAVAREGMFAMRVGAPSDTRAVRSEGAEVPIGAYVAEGWLLVLQGSARVELSFWGDRIGSATFGPSPDWQRFAIPFGAGYGDVSVDVWALPGPLSLMAYVDDVRFVPTPGGTLLANGGFESEVNGDGVPDGWRIGCAAPSAWELAVGDAAGGLRSLRLIDAAASDFCAARAMSVFVAPGHRYRLSAAVDIAQGSLYARVEPGLWLQTSRSGPTDGWLVHEAAACAPMTASAAQVTIVATNKNGAVVAPTGDVRWDSVEFIDLGPC